MKRISLLVVAMLLIQVMSVHAQSKDELNQKIGALTFQLQQANETIARMQKEIDELKAQLESNATHKLVDYRDSISDVIDRYLYTDNVNDRLKFVMEPERVKPLMEKWYNGTVPSRQRDKTNVNYEKLSDKVYWSDDFYLIKTEDGYKIDWEASVCYNPIDNNKYGELPLNEEFEVRGTIYNGGYNLNEEVYSGYSISYIEPDKGFDVFYVEIDSPINKRLKKLMKGSSHEIILKARRTDSSKVNDYIYNYYEITDIVAHNLSKYCPE